MGCELCTHAGVLGGRYAKRCRTAQGRAGGGHHGDDGDSGAGAGGHVGEGHEESLRSASLTISLSCPHLRPKAMRVSVSAGRSGRERCVPAGQRSHGECRNGRWGYYTH